MNDDTNRILDEVIESIQKQLKAKKQLPLADQLKLQDRLLKAVALRQKKDRNKGRGFDLGT